MRPSLTISTSAPRTRKQGLTRLSLQRPVRPLHGKPSRSKVSAHEVNCVAYYIARGPFKFSGSISWTLRAGDPQRAATLALHPLPYRSVEDLLRAGIITFAGVDEEAFRKAVEALPR